MAFIIDRPWLEQKSNNRTPLGFRSGKPFFPITSLQVSLSLPTCALKSPSKTTESPTGAPCRAPARTSKKAAYSKLLFGAYAQTTVRVFPPALRRREATLSSTGVNSNTAVLSRGLVGIPTPGASHLWQLRRRIVSSPYPGVWIQSPCCAWR